MMTILRLFLMGVFSTLLFLPTVLKAGDIEYVVTQDQQLVGTATVLLLEDPLLNSGAQAYTGIAALVYGRENFTDVSGSIWSYQVNYRLIDQATNAIKTGTITLNNSNPKGVYESIGIHNNMSGRMRLEVVSVNRTGAVPNDVRLELRMRVTQYKALSMPFTGSTVLKVGAASHPDVKDHQAMLCWEYIAGAESYEVEWAYWDSANVVPIFDMATQVFSQSITAETYNNYYTVDLVYPAGTVYFRVRAIGRFTNGVNGNYTHRKYSDWSTYQVTPVSFQRNYNWQFTRSFAEDGKHKEVINYFDDGLKSRQTLTTLSSDETTIIAEQLYDAESRPTLSILPVPVRHNTQQENPLQFGSADTLAGRLLYHPSGNQVSYNRTNFDQTSGSNGLKADVLPTSHIAHAYYSSQNPFMNTQAHIGAISDAQGYPMAQVEYLNDGTGRVKRQSGVGNFYQINSGQETQYYYSNPTNTELHRMFGSNVGDAQHYRKNIVQDANGQLTTSYIDQAGQTIATAMMGATPENVQPLGGASATYTESLMGSNVKNPLDRTGIIQHQLFSDQNNNLHTFTYDLNEGISLNHPNNPNFCADCTYEVTFKITDLDGNGVDLVWSTTAPRQPIARTDTTLVFAYKNDADTCKGNSYTPSNSTISFQATLDLGSYRVYKILQVTGPDLAALADEARQSGLLIEQDSFINNFVRNNIDSSQCKPCSDAYREELVAQYVELTQEDLSRTDSLFWVQVDSLMGVFLECETLLDQIALLSFYGKGLDCAAMLQQMKRDISPEGCLYTNNFYGKVALDGNYNRRDSLPATLTDTSGVVHARHSIGYVNLLNDPGQWNETWGDDLVKAHPEYERYTRCVSEGCHRASKLFDFDLMRYNTWDNFLADHAPQLVGTNPSDAVLIKTVIEADPIDGCNTSGKLFCQNLGATLETALLNYCTTIQQNNPGTPSINCTCGSNASALCYLRNHVMNTPAGAQTGIHTIPPSNPPTYTAADYWNLFRGIYTNEKKKLDYRCPSITYPSGLWPNTCPQIAGEPTIVLAGGDTVGVTTLYSGSTLDSALQAMTGSGDTTVTSMCDQICDANAARWMAQLCPELGYVNDSSAVNDLLYRDRVYQAFLEYCLSGCGHMGAPNPPTSGNNPNPMGFLLREDVDAALAAIQNQYNPNDPLQRAIYLLENKPSNVSINCGNMTTIIGTDSLIIQSTTTVYCQTSSQNDPRSALVSVDKCQIMVGLLDALDQSNLFPTQWTSTSGNMYHNSILYNSSFYPPYAASELSGQMRSATFTVTPNSNLAYMGMAGQAGRIDWVTFNNVYDYSAPIGNTSTLLNVDRFIDFRGNFLNAGTSNPACKEGVYAQFGIEFWDANGNAINPFDIVGLVPNTYDCNTNSLRLLVADSSCRWSGSGAVGTACNNPATINIQAFVRMRFASRTCIPNWEIERDTTVTLCNDSTAVTIDTVQAFQDCIALQRQFLQSQAINLYNNYRDSILSTLVNDSCWNVAENFSVQKTQTEQHYTLYYYDEAGNLIQTIPPAGVNLLSASDPQAFNPKGIWQGKEPEHDSRHVTQYQYNTLGQVTQQVSPDGGKTVFWYDYAQRLRLSQSARYVTSDYGIGGKYAYTQYDRKGRIIEVGRLDNYTVDPMDLSTEAFPSNITGTQRSEVIVTEYDELSLTPTELTTNPLNQRGRVVRTYNDNIATYYDYDIHGNVKTLYHQIKNFGAAKISYEYDLITGNVNEVRLMEGTNHEFRHRYWYDADNRLTHTFTSQDGYIWDQDARYFYYPHGPLMRCEKGEDHIQGEDYYYTLQGWIKGVNNTNSDTDLGQDGNNASSNPNKWFAQDQMAYGLGYHSQDYSPIGSINLGLMNPGSHFDTDIKGNASVQGLYNGNIAYMITHLPGLSAIEQPPTQAMVYQYDALHRIKQARSYATASPSTWQTIGNTRYDTDYSYDPNGNLQTLGRNALKQGTGQRIDELDYQYDPNKPNRLIYIKDNQGIQVGNDLASQSPNNYAYDPIGNLIEDKSEQIKTISWNFQNKIEKVVYEASAARENLVYCYGPDGTRLSKTKEYTNGLKETTLYIRDASGNIMATYTIANELRYNLGNPGDQVSYPIGQHYSRSLKEVALYGSSRLGMKQYNPTWEVYAPISTEPSSMNLQTVAAERNNWFSASNRGYKYYEYTNHLSNVLTVLSDKKLYNSTTQTYSAQIISTSDYYPFGLSMYGKQYDSGRYRFGFNGKENDTEYGSSQLVQDYGFRIYNPSIGRFLSTDPLAPEFPFYTPYQFAGNTPIMAIDLDGLELVLQINSRTVTLEFARIAKAQGIEDAIGWALNHRDPLYPEGFLFAKFQKEGGHNWLDKIRAQNIDVSNEVVTIKPSPNGGTTYGVVEVVGIVDVNESENEVYMVYWNLDLDPEVRIPIVKRPNGFVIKPTCEDCQGLDEVFVREDNGNSVKHIDGVLPNINNTGPIQRFSEFVQFVKNIFETVGATNGTLDREEPQEEPEGPMEFQGFTPDAPVEPREKLGADEVTIPGTNFYSNGRRDSSARGEGKYMRVTKKNGSGTRSSTRPLQKER